MTDYFYIANHENGQVLDSKGSEEGDELFLSTAGFIKRSQHWQWDHKGRLFNHLELFADIAKKKKSPGAKVILWSGNDGRNQRWTVDDGVIKSQLNGLVLDGSGPKITMEKQSKKPYQKWDFVPISCWEEYQDLLRDRNPANEALFWKFIAENYIEDVIGCTMDTYKGGIKPAQEAFHEFADELDRVSRGTGATQTVGGVAGITGAGLAIAGLATAPFTAGVSLGLTIAGFWTAFGAGVTGLISKVVNSAWDKIDKFILKKKVDPTLNATARLSLFLTMYRQKVESAISFLENRHRRRQKDPFSCCDIPEEIKLTGKSAWQIYKLQDNIRLTIGCAKLIKSASATGAAAAEAAAPGVTLGKTLITAGSGGAKFLSSGLIAGSIVFGAYDIVDGALSIKNGSKTAEEFRNAAKKLELDSTTLIELYTNLQL